MSPRSNPGTQIQVFNQQMNAPATQQRNVSAPIFLPTATSKAAQSQMIGQQITPPILDPQTASPPHGLYQPSSQQQNQPLSLQQNQPPSQQQRTHNPNSAFRPILTIGNQNSTNHPPPTCSVDTRRQLRVSQTSTEYRYQHNMHYCEQTKEINEHQQIGPPASRP